MSETEAPYSPPSPPPARTPGRRPLYMAGGLLAVVLAFTIFVSTPNPKIPETKPPAAPREEGVDADFQRLQRDAAVQRNALLAAQRQNPSRASWPEDPSEPGSAFDDSAGELDREPGTTPDDPDREGEPDLASARRPASGARNPTSAVADPNHSPIELSLSRSGGASSGSAPLPPEGFPLTPPLPDLSSILQPIAGFGDPRSPSPLPAETSPARNQRFLRESDSGGSKLLEPHAGALLLPAGTKIPATLVTAINSDLPGTLLAYTNADVFDSSGRAVLIPKGSRLFGRYSAEADFGQARLFFVWTEVLFPDHRTRLDLGALPGTDPAGAAGVHDRSDQHLARAFGSAVLLSLLSAGGQLSQPNSGYRSNTVAPPSAGEIAAGALGQQLTGLGTKIADRYLDLRPTLEVRAGTLIAADVIRPLYLKPVRIL